MSGISGKVNEKSYDIADIVLGKIKGFPPWPARVVDPEEVPAAVTADRPTGKKYYCVRFFPAGDFAWLTARDINPLPTTEINKFLAAPKGVKRSIDLLSGYKIALDPTEWESTINERIAKAAEASAAGDDDDELEEEEGEGKKKRRRSEGGATGGSAKKKRRTTKAGKSAEMVESEDDAAGNVSTISAAPTSAVPTKKKDKDEEDEKFAHLKDDKGAQHIKLVRHALQKMFLSKTAPTDKDIENGDGLFKELEAGDIPLDYLGYSKIGKVMRHIASLEDAQIPREAEFKFKIRAQDLVAKWHKVAANNPNSRASAGATAAPANGNGV